MNRDLTVIYYTANHIREPFGAYVRWHLTKAIGDAHLISVSHKPMDFGANICVDMPRSFISIYRQILLGAQMAQTPWVALAEDDILYPPGHYDYRPSSKAVAAYEMHRWAIYTWVKPAVFLAASRRHTVGMIASRDLVVAALEERFAKYQNDEDIPLPAFAEIGRYERNLGVTVRKTEGFSSPLPTVVFFHHDALGFEYLGKRKRQPERRVKELPYWGRAALFQEIYDLSGRRNSG
jgi:hypothetical protein